MGEEGRDVVDVVVFSVQQTSVLTGEASSTRFKVIIISAPAKDGQGTDERISPS